MEKPLPEPEINRESLPDITSRRSNSCALVKPSLAARIPLSNVVEISLILRRIRQFAVNPGQLIHRRLLLIARCVYDSRKCRRSPTRATHRIPPTLHINRGTTKIRRHVRIPAMRPNNTSDPTLITRYRLIGTDISAAPARVVNLAEKISLPVAIEVRAPHRHHIRRRSRINTPAQPRIPRRRKINHARSREKFVP